MKAKKYKVIAKVNDDKFVKYNVNNLMKFVQFLDKDFEGWRWFNVYDKKTKLQIANFTTNKRPNNVFI
jgi:hypothetical protein